MKQSVKSSVKKSVDKATKLAPKKMQPLIKETSDRIVEKADQVLLGLSHTKESVPALFRQTLQRIEHNPSDLVGRVSRSVLERAETVRKQLIEKAEDSEQMLKTRWVPEWLKDVSFVRASAEASPAVEESHVAGDAADTIAAVEKKAGNQTEARAGKKDSKKKSSKSSRSKKA